MWDCFVNCDFVTYPTSVEGFGNQFIETIYFRKPIVITPYPVFESDIKPCGFKVITMPDRVTKEVINNVRSLVNNPGEVEKMVDYNYKLGKKYFDYEVVERKLKSLFKEMKLQSN